MFSLRVFSKRSQVGRCITGLRLLVVHKHHPSTDMLPYLSKPYLSNRYLISNDSRFLHDIGKNHKSGNGKHGCRCADNVRRACVATGTSNRGAVKNRVVVGVNAAFATILTIPSNGIACAVGGIRISSRTFKIKACLAGRIVPAPITSIPTLISQAALNAGYQVQVRYEEIKVD